MNALQNKSSGVPADRRIALKRIVPVRYRLFWCLLLFALAVGNQKMSGQGVGINETAPIVPHASSILELQSTARGFLAPRMTSGQRTTISGPAQGLLVYDTDTKSFWYYDLGWKALPSSSIGWGTANQLLGMNTLANGNEYKSLLGSANLTVTHAVGSITLNTIQDITTASSPSFTGLTLANPLTVPNGGTGINSGISGGIPYFNSNTTMASSALLTANGVVIGGGASTAPSTIGVGAANTVLRGTGAAPVFGKIINPDLNADAVTTDKILDGTIVDADVNATAAIDATKIAAGTVDNTEFGYLNGVTNPIQSQFSNVQIELDATENGAGLNNDGTYTANGAAHYISTATSLKDADNKVDAQLFTTTTDLASEVTRATNAESVLTTNLNNEITRATAAEAVLTTNLATEVSRATAAEATLTANLATETTNRIAADAAIQTELDATENGAGLNNDGTYTANGAAHYISTATSLKDADNKLDGQLFTTTTDLASEVTRATNAETVLTTNLNNEITRATAAEAVLTTNLATEVSRATAAEATLTANLATETTNRIAADAAIQTELDATENGAGLNNDGTYTANGSANYIKTATSLKDADNKLDAQVKINTDNIATSSTDITNLQTEVNNVEAGSGLNADGTYTANGSAHYISTATDLKDADNKLDAQLFTTTTDLASEVTRATNAESVLTTNLNNEITRATAAEAVLTTNLATEVSRATAAEATLTANLATETTNRTAADAAIQTELDATENGAGLNNDGTYTANGAAHYISTAASLKDADNKTDAQLFTTTTDLASEVTRATNAESVLTTNLNNEITRATAAEAVLTTNLATEVTRATAAEATLTANLATETTNRIAADAAIQTELDATENGAGLNNDGTYTANGSANYISTATSLKDADNKLDAQTKTNTDNISTGAGNLAAEITRATNAEAVLTTNLNNEVTRATTAEGVLTTNLATEVSRATAAEATLTANLSTETTNRTTADAAIQTELDATENGAGLNNDGTYTANGAAHYISTAASLKDADNKTDAQLFTTTTNLASEVTRATNAETVLTTNLNNEVARATAAEGVLTTNLATEVTRATAAETTLTANLATETTNRTAADAAIQTELDATENGGGLNNDGTYSPNGSSNYIKLATSLKDADNKLDAQVKTNADNIAAATIDYTNVQNEVNNIEAGSGLNADGTYTANGAAHYISTATSLNDADNKLDAQLFTTTGNLASEVTRATGAETTLTNNLASEVTRATGAETALGTSVTNEVARATAAEGTLTTNLTAEVTRATGAETAIASNLTTETTNRTAADAAIQTELNTTQAGAGLNTDGTYAVNGSAHYISTAISLNDADNKLDAQLFTTTGNLASEVTRATGAETTLTNNLASEVTRATGAETALGTSVTNEVARATAAEGTLTTNLSNEVSRATGAETALSTSIATETTNRTTADAAIQTELNTTQAGAGLNTDGTYAVNGTAHYISTATSLNDADNKLDAQLFTTTGNLASEVTRATGAETTLTNNLASEVTRATGVETALGTSVTNETNRATAAEGTLTTNLTAEVTRATGAETALSTSIATETTNRTTADAAIQTELNTTQAGVGLNTDGTYAVNGSAHYISTAISLNDADNKLDAQLFTTTGNLASEVTRATGAETTLTNNLATEVTRATGAETAVANNLTTETTNRTTADAAIQTELNTTQAGAGLNTDGTYAVNGSAHYISTAISLNDADNKLDAQLFTTTGNLASEVTRATGAETTLTNNLATEVTRATGAETAIANNLTTETTNRTTAVAAVQTELNTTQAGAGLNTDGTYAVNGTAHYISTATSLNDADNKLDAQLFTTTGNLASEVTRATGAETTLTNNLATEVTRATGAETAVANNLTTETTNRSTADGVIQTELDAAENGAGLNASGTYSANGTANYINAATSLKDADNKLDAQAKTNADNIALKANANQTFFLGTTSITINRASVSLALTGITSIDGNAATATTATNLTGGSGGSIPYQTGAGATTMLANGAAGQVLTSNGTTLAPSWTTPTNGTVTSVGLSLPGFITVSNSPVTGSGTLTGTLASQAANTVFIAPNGSAGAPTFRTLVAGDIPNIAESQVTNLATDLSNRALTSTTVNGHALSANVTISATDITTGTLPHAQLPPLVSGDIPNNSANTLGNAATATTATTATNAVNTGITNDVATASAVYPTWVTANSGNLPQYVSSAKLSFVPSTGVLTATSFTGSGAGLTSIPNSALSNSSVTVGTTAINLGSNATTIVGLTSVTSTSFTGALTGNATTATTASNLSGGGVGYIPYQSGASATGMLAAGTSGQVLTSGGAGAPTWTNPTNGTVTNFSAGDLSPLFTTTEASTTTTPALSFTLSNAAAYSILGNNTVAAATPTYFTPVLASALFLNQGGATTNVLHGNNAGNPSWGQIVNGDIANTTIDLTAKVTGILPGGNGGTGNAYTSFSGPSGAVKTFTLPNATSTILTTNAAVTVGQGGTGLATGTQGGLPYFNSTTTMASTALLTQYGVVIGGGSGSAPSSIAAGANNTVLHGNTGAAPTFSAVSLTADVSGTLPIGSGGTNNGSLGVTNGGVIYADGSKLMNTGVGTAGQVLRSNGAAAPVWSTPNTYQQAPGNLAGISNTTGLMLGLAQPFTPSSSGKVLIIISGDITNDTGNDGGQVQIRFGTGLAPVNGGVLAGTPAGSVVKMTSTGAVAGRRYPFTVNAVVTLSAGANWIDLSLAAITGGTANVYDVSVSIVEL